MSPVHGGHVCLLDAAERGVERSKLRTILVHALERLPPISLVRCAAIAACLTK